MSNENSIAIVGMSGRFPGAPDLSTYWRRLVAGDECITFFNASNVDPAAQSLVGRANFVMAGGILSDIDRFDADVFRMSGQEAALTDPQHRMFLECAWEALEDAGYGDPEQTDAVIGVYGGAALSSYASRARGHAENAHDELHALVGVAADYLPALVSYKLDLHGESFAVQAACSTSLVAVHLGCQSLLTGQTDIVLAGAASIDARQHLGYLYEAGTTLSPDGHCRPFSADAQGTVRGFGVGVVALRRLEDALDAGDPIRAVIRGSAVTNDGRARVGFTAPSVAGQMRAAATAIAVAGVESDSIGYVEAHGTATPLGDAMEIDALTRALATSRRGYCSLGAVKANIGHLSEASGIAGLVKAVLALEHAVRPGLFNYTRANPAINFAETPFCLHREPREWDGEEPRRAAVSGYAVGGTNVHIVLEQAPRPTTARAAADQPLLFLFSGASSEALASQHRQLGRWLADHTDVNLRDVAWTLRAGRRPLGYRSAVIACSVAELIEALHRDDAGGVRAAANAPGDLMEVATRWIHAERIDANDLDAAIPPARRLRLPTYPFQRRQHWLEPAAASRVHGLTWWLDAPGDTHW